RPHAASNALLGVLARVNSDLFARSAAHADYVTAGCSISAVLIVRERGYVVHAGGTAAYLVHDGGVQTLTADDTFEDIPKTLLARALGTSANLDVCVSNFSLRSGNVLVLVAHRIHGDIDRRSLIAHVEGTDSSEQLLVVRFDDADRVRRNGRTRSERPRQHLMIVLTCAVALCALLASTGWAR
ncbi:MAG: hypothetical protein ACYDGM_09310, partial [Vulcanimicrobiaceae bacterium]